MLQSDFFSAALAKSAFSSRLSPNMREEARIQTGRAIRNDQNLTAIVAAGPLKLTSSSHSFLGLEARR